MKFLVLLFFVVGCAVAIPYRQNIPEQHHQTDQKQVQKQSPIQQKQQTQHYQHKRDVNEKSAAITDQHFKSDPEGNFEYNYETQNGISARAIGSPKQIPGNPPEVAEVIQGNFAWTSPEGKLVNVQYTADERGYFPKVVL